MKEKKQAVRRRNMVLVAMMLGVLLVSAGSIALAAPETSSASQKETTIIDPYAIKIVAVSGEMVSVQAIGAAVRRTPRNLVRVPVRPAVRSPFRPLYD